MIESSLPPTLTFEMSLLVLPIPFLPPFSSVSKPTIPISTLGVPIFDILKPLQPQVVDATPTTLLIMSHLDTLQKLNICVHGH